MQPPVIAYVNLYVSDLARSIAFFGDVFYLDQPGPH